MDGESGELTERAEVTGVGRSEIQNPIRRNWNERLSERNRELIPAETW